MYSTFRLLVSFVILLVINSNIRGNTHRFYTKQNGLKGTFFFDLMQDSNNYIWICTKSGLNRFDGFTFLNYQYKINDPTSINSSSTTTAFQDLEGRLWVGTIAGLNEYSYENDNFRRISLSHHQQVFGTPILKIIQKEKNILYLITNNGLVLFNTLTDNNTFFNISFEDNGLPSTTEFNDAFFDEDDNIWISSNLHGIYIFNTKEKTFTSFNDYTRLNFRSRNIRRIEKIRSGDIVIGDDKGQLFIYNHSSNQLTQLQTNHLIKGGIESILEDNNHTIWIGTEYNGLYSFKITDNKLQDENESFDINNIENANVHCSMDANGDIWFSVNYIGLYHRITPDFNFNSISPQNSALNYHLIRSLLKDDNGNLWIGTDGGGLSIYNTRTQKITPFKKALSSDTPSWNPKAILRIFKDSRGLIWIGTYSEGLASYSPQTKKITRYPIAIKNNTKALNRIFDIEEDKHGNLWLATNGNGLIYFDVEKKMAYPIEKMKPQNEILKMNKHYNDVYLEGNGNIWIAMYYGLAIWNHKKNSYTFFSDQHSNFSNDPVYCIEKLNANVILIGTYMGLYSYNIQTSELKKYTAENGLVNNTVTSIIPVSNDIAWLSTSNGISKFNNRDGSFVNFTQYDGLPFNEFLVASRCKGQSGEIYFGGVNGFISFYPDSIKVKQTKPKLFISDFKIFNRKLINGYVNEKRRVLQKAINYTDTINLKYADKNFSFEFAAHNITSPERIQYAYKLEGFNDEWTYTDYQNRIANYSNLSAGTYIFLLKSTDLSGEWIEPPRKVTIIMYPPFWQSKWAYLIYFVIIAGLIILISASFRFRVHMKNKLQIEHIEHLKNESLSQAKFQFFTNISHDIRTPLSMIMAPLQNLLKTSLTAKQKDYASYINRNAKRMQQLVDQLLELHKAGNTNQTLIEERVDVVSLINDLISLFDISAEMQNIKLVFETNHPSLKVISDKYKLDRVLYNIISNAIKHTPEGGEIKINLDINISNKGTGNDYTITISDNGEGISSENLNKIFDRYYQIKSTNNEVSEGLGIGLDITLKLVKLLHGEIKVESTPQKGTSFSLSFPLQLTPEMSSEKPTIKETTVASDPFVIDEDHKRTSVDAKNTILFVEDDLEILSFLEKEFKSDYNIIKATNGEMAWKMLQNDSPTLVLSDVSMPKMNGTELCKKIKSTFETSHIPVILLTARIAPEDEISGIETGADDYIHKPFNIQILRLKIQNIIEAREVLKKRFSQTNNFVAKEMTVTSPDEIFLQKAIDYVKEHLESPELSVEKMCGELNISRVHLYRKLKALTNQSPTEFIRIIRLKQAASLLIQNKLNVSEIAYMVGFNSHQYFSNSFQKHFNMSPKEYITQHQK